MAFARYRLRRVAVLFNLLAALAASLVSAQQTLPAFQSPHFADYDAELRGTDGRVDTDALAQRLEELGVTTYYWLIIHAPTDWDDLKLFLPKANHAHIQVWVYLVPPSESLPRAGNLYPEPFRLDYQRWGEEIARLSLQHTNLTAWVIDDFYQNRALYTPEYVAQMQKRAKAVNPNLAFLPLMYFREITRKFVQAYQPVIDGVIVAYPQGPEEIENARAILNGEAQANPGELSFPHYTPSHAGDFVMVSQNARELLAPRHLIGFRERDDYTGPTAGYHFKQVLLNDHVVWEEDVAGGTNAWREVTLDLGNWFLSPTQRTATVSFRLLDKKSVGNFGVRWQISSLRSEGLQFVGGELTQPRNWKVARQGEFEAGFGENLSGPHGPFHIPFTVMTTAQEVEFRLRHGDPANPERIASWLRMCLQEYHDGKCDGVVTYCLDKSPKSAEFPLARQLFWDFSKQR